MKEVEVSHYEVQPCEYSFGVNCPYCGKHNTIFVYEASNFEIEELCYGCKKEFSIKVKEP